MDRWPSAVVASFVIVLVGAIALAAILKYTTVDDALKFWSALSGLVGIITGAMATSFFTRNAVQTAQQSAKDATDLAKRSSDEAKAGHAQATSARAQLANAQRALALLSGKLEPTVWDELQATPTIKAALAVTPEGG